MLKCTFGLDRLQLTLRNQLLENSHRSGGPIVYQVVADVVLAGNIGLKLRFFPDFFRDVSGDRNFAFGIRCFE